MPTVRLAHLDTGGDGPALVFVHGFLMDRTGFTRQVEALRDRFRCIAVDQRGAGDTPAETAFTLWDSADDIAALLDELGIATAVLVGASMGGFVCLRFALRYPGRLAGLVLIGSEPGLGSAEARAGNAALIGSWAGTGDLDALHAAVGQTLFGRDDLVQHHARLWRAQPREAIALPGAAVLERDDLSERMSEVACPAFLINGTDDPVVPPAAAIAVALALRDCRGVWLVPGAPHAPYLTHPDLVNAALTAFLAMIAPAAGRQGARITNPAPLEGKD